MSIVLDSSAALAVIRAEPGGEAVAGRLAGATMSAVNIAEVVARLVERGATDEAAEVTINGLGVHIVPFDASQALAAGLLRRRTRAAGLSLGDRACLALASSLKLPALTADRAWSGLDIGVEIELIR